MRDFRDMALSILAFDASAASQASGAPRASTDEEYVSSVLKPAAQSLTNSWRTRGRDSHLVRYEDLMAQPRATLAAMLEYLELDAGDPTLDAILASAEMDSDEMRGHRTSRGAERLDRPLAARARRCVPRLLQRDLRRGAGRVRL